MHVCVLSHLVLSDSVQPYGLWPARLLWPWGSPGKNSGVGCHALLQGDLPDPGTELMFPMPPAGGFSTTSAAWEEAAAGTSSVKQEGKLSWGIGFIRLGPDVGQRMEIHGYPNPDIYPAVVLNPETALTLLTQC